MAKDDGLGEFLFVVAGFLIWWLIDQNNRKGTIIKGLVAERSRINEDLEKLKETLDKTTDLTSEIKAKLNELINKYKDVDPNIATELSGAFVLVEVRQPIKAIMSLGKIIENQLKKLFEGNSEFEAKYIKRDFYNHLEFAKETKILDKDEYHYANAIREIRNQEAHELNVQKDNSWICNGLLVATDLILKLNVLRKRTDLGS